MAITLQRITHPTDTVANAMHSAVADVVLQANAQIDASTPAGITNKRIDERAIAPGRALIWTGTSFPGGTPATGTLFFRTDRNVLYYYDGTRWLSQLFCESFSTYAQLWAGFSGTNTLGIMTCPHDFGGGTVYLERLRCVTQQQSGAPAAFWTLNLKNSAASTLATFNTSADTATADTIHEVTINAVRTIATDKYWFLQPAATGAPGVTSLLGAHLEYRLIG